MSTSPERIRRRHWLGLALAAACSDSAWAGGAGRPSTAPAAGAAPRGLVVPRLAAPSIALTDAEGRAQRLEGLLRGHTTCLQLMFVGCGSVCPAQGALFAALAASPLPADVQLVSITIDPLSDGPTELRRWLERFAAPRMWRAAAPRIEDTEPLGAFLHGAPVRPDTHGTQAYLFDRQARLAFRTVDQPTPEHLAWLLRQLSQA